VTTSLVPSPFGEKDLSAALTAAVDFLVSMRIRPVRRTRNSLPVLRGYGVRVASIGSRLPASSPPSHSKSAAIPPTGTSGRFCLPSPDRSRPQLFDASLPLTHGQEILMPSPSGEMIRKERRRGPMVGYYRQRRHTKRSLRGFP
jgi:hypothetical protein